MNAQKEVVLITGGSGNIGSALIKRLTNAYEITGFDASGSPPSPAHCIPADLESDASIEQALEKVRHQFGNRIGHPSRRLL